MRICARCTGIYLGYLAFIPFVWQFFTTQTLPNPLLMAALHLPLLLDGGTQAKGLRESNNALRLVTGGMAGVGQIGFLIWFGLSSGTWFAHQFLL